MLRAHQRATRDYVPISVCSVLLENLQNQGLTWTGLPEGCGPYDAYHLSDHNVGMSRYVVHTSVSLKLTVDPH